MNIFTFNDDFGGHRSLFCEAADVIGEDGEQFVRLEDHVASHAFDEEKERALFEDEMVCRGYSVQKFDSGDYINHSTRNEWSGWLACAKSRANQ